MPSSDDDIIRNGTFWQWLNYEIVFGGTKGTNQYLAYPTLAGGKRIKAYWIVGPLLLALGLAIYF